MSASLPTPEEIAAAIDLDCDCCEEKHRATIAKAIQADRERYSAALVRGRGLSVVEIDRGAVVVWPYDRAPEHLKAAYRTLGPESDEDWLAFVPGGSEDADYAPEILRRAGHRSYAVAVPGGCVWVQVHS